MPTSRRALLLQAASQDSQQEEPAHQQRQGARKLRNIDRRRAERGERQGKGKQGEASLHGGGTKSGSARVHADFVCVPPKWEDQNPSKRARGAGVRAGLSTYWRTRRAQKPSATTPTASSGRVLEISGTDGAGPGPANAEMHVAKAARRRRVFIGIRLRVRR